MSTPSAASSSTPPVPDLIGLDIVNRANGQVEATITFTAEEVSMPGYVESRMSAYDNNEHWEAVKVWRSHIEPAATIKVVETMRQVADLLTDVHDDCSRLDTTDHESHHRHEQAIRTGEEALAQVRLLLDRLHSNVRINGWPHRRDTLPENS